MIAKDKFGTDVTIGDNICFVINLRKDTKPIVKAKVSDIIPFGSNYMAVCDYCECADTEWAKRENKLPEKIIISRAVKCY